MAYQPIYNIAELFFKRNIKEVVLCPGSRCAPLTLAFTRRQEMTTRTFSDERSAAFIGLGIAQDKKQPTILVCTSGSAAYNFAPAVAEAYFSETPLIIFTADRPAEWIAQHDGQTIYQPDIFGKHVKQSYQLPQDYEHADSLWAINRIVNEAINLSLQEPQGPVHINAPFREPLYPHKDDVVSYDQSVRTIELLPQFFELTSEQKNKVVTDWPSFNRVMIVAGQQDYNSDLSKSIAAFSEKYHVPVLSDIISNLNEEESVVTHSDLFLGQASEALKKTLQPDLLITFGKSMISKNLKLFLRKYSPRQHWHIQAAGNVADSFKNVTAIFNTTPKAFFEFVQSLPHADKFHTQKQQNFQKLWQVEERRANRALNEFFPQEELNELEVVREVIRALPDNSNLHLANSMSVRYGNFIGIESVKKGIRVFSNRGTSGIDGCTSTAVGHTLSSGKLNLLITGDVAFFYDRNAFWNNYPIPNLKILLLNNHGGSIFSMIDGPASQPEAQEYFITRQRLKADHLCAEFGFDHLFLDHKRKLRNFLKDFFDPEGKTKILEVETDIHINRTIFDNLKKQIKNSYES